MTNQIDIGDLIQMLGAVPADFDVVARHGERDMRLDGAIRSYRGYYDEAAIGYVSNEVDAVSQVVEAMDKGIVGHHAGRGMLSHAKAGIMLLELRKALVNPHEAYKGGIYRFGDSTPLWISNWGEASDVQAVGIAVDYDAKLVVIKADAEPQE